MHKKSPSVSRESVALACLLALAALAPPAQASHIGEEFTLDQQVVASSDQLLGALRQYESASGMARQAAAQRLMLLAQQRRERLLAVVERNPRLAALRVMPAALRERLPAAVQALVETEVTVTGVIQATIADDIANGRSRRTLYVSDSAGRPWELRADASDRDQLSWVGRQATVRAVQIDRLMLVKSRKDVLLAADGTGTGTTTTTTATAPAITGDQRTLVIMTNFTDRANGCTVGDLQSRMFGVGTASVNEAYRQSSGGMVSFSGNVIGPFTINYSSTGSCDINGWAAAANAAAAAAGFNPGAYQRVSYSMPSNANCGFGGIATLGGTAPTPSWIMTCTSTGMFAHELGHNLGLHHAATPTAEYGDASDPMGAARLVQNNAPNRVMAGWVSGTQLLDVTTSGNYAVEALENAAAGQARVLRLAKPDTQEYYYLSLRQPIGLDTNLWSSHQNTLSVHRSTGARPAHTFLLANLAPGQSWTDSANGITVTMQGISGATASVGVAMGSTAPSCVRQAPTVSIAPTSQTAAPGTALSYSVTVANRNSSACPTSSFTLAQSLPSGFVGSWSASALSLASGATGTAIWTVASGSTSSDAMYTLSATATDATGGSSTQAHASYTVVAPTVTPTEPPPPPPPAPTDTTAPTLAITSPAANATVSGRFVTIMATATDSAGVAKVEFYVNGKLLTTDTATPYAANWNTRKAARGVGHEIRVRAVDVNGNAAERSITVLLN